MTRCIVDFFGLPPAITESKIEIEVKATANLRDIIDALRRKLPSLEKSVIVAGEDRLVEGYAFNINGLFYADNSDEDGGFHLQDGNRIALLSLPTGG